jgi:glycosyltransferase involved in cell wall biosynthesis
MGKALNKDLVSVIIPTYNRAMRCKAAVESVLSQTHGNVEVVVVDDGSRDNTREVISGMDNRVKYIGQANAGVSAARNTGLKAATGDYIAFLDSDDSWLPWKLEAQLSVLRAFPEAGMVWTDMLAVDESGTRLHESYLKLMYAAYAYFDREKHFRTSRQLSDLWDGCPDTYADRKCYAGNIFSWMFMGNLVHTSTALLRRDRQKKVGLFDVELIKSGEDYDFHFRTCREGDVAYIDAPSIRYQVGAADQLTQPEHIGWIATNNLRTVKKMYDQAKNEIHLPGWMIRKRMSDSYGWAGLTQFDANRRNARALMMKSLLISPFQGKLAIYLCLSAFSSKTVSRVIEIEKKIVHPMRSH